MRNAREQYLRLVVSTRLLSHIKKLPYSIPPRYTNDLCCLAYKNLGTPLMDESVALVGHVALARSKELVFFHPNVLDSNDCST